MIATTHPSVLILNSCLLRILSSMNVSTERQMREFVEMLAVPERTPPPECPLCGRRHRLEKRCDRRAALAGR